MAFLSEADLEDFLMDELAGLGFAPMTGSQLSPDAATPLRPSYHEAILGPVLADSLRRINPTLPARALAEAARKVADAVFATDLVQENRRLHRLLVDGVKVTYAEHGEERNAVVRLIDWDDGTNDWRAVRQMDVVGRSARIPDVVLVLNGMPLVVDRKSTRLNSSHRT